MFWCWHMKKQVSAICIFVLTPFIYLNHLVDTRRVLFYWFYLTHRNSFVSMLQVELSSLHQTKRRSHKLQRLPRQNRKHRIQDILRPKVRQNPDLLYFSLFWHSPQLFVTVECQLLFQTWFVCRHVLVDASAVAGWVKLHHIRVIGADNVYGGCRLWFNGGEVATGTDVRCEVCLRM